MGKPIVKFFKSLIMPVRIQPITDHELYEVNGKEVFKDGENWTARVELTTQEKAAFTNYRKAVINNKNFTKHTKATYNG